eukprot:10743146-Heterocapsa_arctica.AAC.1
MHNTDADNYDEARMHYDDVIGDLKRRRRKEREEAQRAEEQRAEEDRQYEERHPRPTGGNAGQRAFPPEPALLRTALLPLRL